MSSTSKKYYSTQVVGKSASIRFKVLQRCWQMKAISENMS